MSRVVMWALDYWPRWRRCPPWAPRRRLARALRVTLYDCLALVALVVFGCHPGPKPTPVTPPGLDLCLSADTAVYGGCGTQTKDGYPCAECEERACVTLGLTYCVGLEGCSDAACGARGKR